MNKNIRYGTYHGCESRLEGQKCEIVGVFSPGTRDNNGDLRMIGLLHHIEPRTKYMVTFPDGSEVNVYGKNLRPIHSVLKEHLFYEHPKPREVYRYVSVQHLRGDSQEYHYLNADVRLTSKDIVAVQAGGSYSMAKVKQCWHADSDHIPKGFDKAHAYIVSRVDEERMADIAEKDGQRKRLTLAIKNRVKYLRDMVEMTTLMSEDQELASLVEERNSLES